MYGALYNGYTINTNKLAPTGWHIPTLEDWFLLLTNSGGYERLKESGSSHWNAPVGNNLTGFTATPGGICYPEFKFYSLGTSAFWWSTVQSDEGYMNITLDINNGAGHGGSNNSWGNSVRCILGTLSIPVISSSQAGALDIMPNSATIRGTVTDVGGPPVTSRGICWNINQFPTIADSKTSEGSGFGHFTSLLTGLSPKTTYFFRAYAINSAGISYGESYFFTTQSENIQFNPNLSYGSVADVDGNVYKTIAIGQQTWFAENLRTTKYNDGTAIPKVTDNTTWSYLTSGAYCYYNNDETNKNTHGALYNWHTVNTEKLCPVGWHVPTINEWKLLTDFMGSGSGGKLKEAGTGHWIRANSNATNESGFSALPGGIRMYNGEFNNLNIYGFWWSSTLYSPQIAWLLSLNCDNNNPDWTTWLSVTGNSVRCLKD